MSNPESSPTTTCETSPNAAPRLSLSHAILGRLDAFLTRNARLILFIYWPLLAISTHMPDPQLFEPGQPTVFQHDKIIHVFAFGLLTYLIIRARILTAHASYALTCLTALILASTYACIDEFTQAYVGRQVSDADLIASIIGILTVYLLSVAPPPYPGKINWRIWPARATWLIIAPTLTLLTILRQGNRVIGWIYRQFMQTYPGLDKDTHFVLAIILTALLAASTPLGRRRPKLSILFTIAIMGISAPVIEHVQKFTGRGFDLADVFKHMQGFILVLIAWTIYAAVRSFRLSSLTESTSEKLPLTYTPKLITTEPLSTASQQPRHFINYALIVSALTFLSRIFGLIRDSILAWAFGLSPVGNAFFVAFTIPNLFRRLFGEGALTAAFIPHYTRLTQSDPVIARRFAYLVISLLITLLASITLLGELGLFLFNHFGNYSENTHLILKLTMIMLPYMPLICLVAVIGGILQVHHRFGPPAAAPVILNLTMIGFAVCAGLFYSKNIDHFGPRIVTIISLGVLTAGLIQVAFLTPTLFHLARPTLNFSKTAEHIRSMLFMMMPMLIGLAVLQINTLFDTLIALFFSMPDLTADPTASTTILNTSIEYPMDANSVSALYFAQRLYQFPLAIFGIAIATAIFPAFSHTASRIIEASRKGDPTEPHRKQFQTHLHHGIRLTIFLGLPAAVGIILIREPLVRLLFQYNNFNAADTARVAHILVGYAISIWAYSLIHVLTRAYYAHKDSLTPLKISVSMVIFNLLLNLTLIWPLGTAGLAYSTAASAIIQVILLLYFIKAYSFEPISKSVAVGILHTIVLTFLMAVSVFGFLTYFQPITQSRTQSAIILFATVALGGIIYLAAAFFTRAEEISWLRKKSV
ncbi:murein biosynthesis integral membrane protein MurJ [Planctomycetota bacterium]|nr:murein biosynthesis integral membrane protein MurJ [Planctomycetota bacterium]